MSDPAAEAALRHLETLLRFGGHSQLQLQGKDLTAAAREALQPVRNMHKPLTIMYLAPNCGAEMCDHEDDCPADYPVNVCAKCWEIAELVSSYYGEEGIDQSLIWPCDTAKAVYPTEELEMFS